MSNSVTKFAGTKIFRTNVIEFDVTDIKLTNSPALNNANNSLISRNNVTGFLEIVDKSTFAVNNLTLQNLAGNAIVIAATVPLPGPAQFKGLVAGTGITLTPTATSITITNTNPSPTPSTNIYNADGSLLADRTVLMNNNDLTFTTGASSSFNITSISAFNANLIPNITLSATSNMQLSSTGTLSVSANVGNVGIDSGANIEIGRTNANNVYIGRNPLGANEIQLFAQTLRFMNISLNKTNYVLNFDPTVGSKFVTYSELVSYYGGIRYSAQTTQSITSVTPAIVTGVTGIAGSYNVGIALSAGNGALYTGSSAGQLFEITFVGTIAPTTGASQEITITIFNEGSEISSARNTITAGSASGNVSIATLPVVAGINTIGNGIRVGFARSTTNTTIVFSGTLFVRNV